MKKTAFSISKRLSLSLMATILTGAALSVAAAPQSKGAPAPMKTRKKPGTPRPAAAPRTLDPAASKSAGSAAPALGRDAEATPGAQYSASRFPGVSVRHVPAPSPTRSTQTRSHDGIVVGNVRPAPDPRDGIIGDVDPNSYPDEVVIRRAPKKTVKKARATKTARTKATGKIRR